MLNVLGAFVQENPALVKGVATFTGVVGGATVALTAYAAISKVIKALDMATLFAGPAGAIMLGVTAVAALAAGIVALSEASRNDGVPSVRELTEAARELDSAMNDAKAACSDTVTTTEASANVASNYIDRLDELNALSELSAEQQREYHGILVMLTQTVPELANFIDLETDTINGGTEALRANTQAWKDNAIAQAYQEQLTEIYSKNADVLIEAEKNKIGLRDAEGKLAVAQKAQNDEFERQNRLYQEANQKVQDYFVETGLVTDASMWLGETTDELNRKLEQNAQAVFAAQNEVGAYQKAIEKDNEALEAAQDEIALAEEAVQNLTSATEDATSATDDASRGYGELSAEISSAMERVEAITQAYNDAYDSAQESIRGQYSLWQEADSIIATSASSINTNLQGQITHWQTYNENLASLRERTGDIEGLSDLIGSFADGSADSVNAIAGMAAASDEDLTAMVANWKKLREEQDKAAEDIADFRTGFSEFMDAISADLENAVDGMDYGTEAAAAGRATIQGFIDGATGMLPTVQQAYSQLGSAALAALNRNGYYNGSFPNRRMSGFSRYASGTTSAEAGLALVGEEGPEFVMMHGGEAVLNAADTHSAIEAMTATSDSAVPVQVNITVEGDVNDGVMDRLESYGEEFAEHVRAVIREDNINAQRGAYR